MAQMTEKELDELLSGAAAPSLSVEADAASATTTMTEADLNVLLAGKLRDENTDEVVPLKVSGLAPDSAINESVLSLTDRAKLTLGDPAGKIEYLKTRYEDAMVNPKGDLVVKKDDKWYYADPKGYTWPKDPWSLSKEVIADAAVDQFGDLIIAGSAIGTGLAAGGATLGIGTAGGGVAGAAAGEYLRSSLGRIVGTYSADPLQQSKDIAFETLMQLAGEKFVPGVKKGLDKVADGVEKLGIKAATEDGARKLAKFYSKFNVGEGPMDTITRYGREVKNKMKEVAKATGNDDKRFIERLTSDSIQQVKSLAAKSPKILSETYNKFQSKIVDAVDDSFKSNIRQTAIEGYVKSIDDGIAKVVRGGKDITNPEELAKLLRYATESGRLPKGTNIVLKSQDELLRDIQRSGVFDNNALKLASDSEAYSLLKRLHSNLDIAFNSKTTQGKSAAKNMMAFKREMGDILFNLSSKADDAGLNSLRKSFEGYSSIVEKNTKSALDAVGQGGLYSQMNKSYAELARELKPLQNAHIRSFRGTGGDQPFEALLNKLKSNPGKNQLSKSSIEAVEAAAEALGDSQSAQAIRQSRVALDINEAAAAFNPYVTRPGATGATIIGYGVLTGNWALVAAAGGISGTAGSPTVTKNLVYGTQNLWRGMNALKSEGAGFVNQLAKDPQAASSFINTILSSTGTQTQINNQLMSQIMPEAGAEQPIPDVMLEGARSAGETTSEIPTAQVSTREIDMERVRANTLDIKPKNIDYGPLSLTVDSESNYDIASNNLRHTTDLGGLSLGIAHLSSTFGGLQDFLKTKGYTEITKGLNLKTQEGKEMAAARWAEVAAADPEKFAKDQLDFITKDWKQTKDMKKAFSAVTGTSIDKAPEAIQKLFYSTHIAQGYEAKRAFKAIRGIDLKSEQGQKQAVEAMNLARLDYWANSARGRKDVANVKGWAARTLREQQALHKDLTGKEMDLGAQLDFVLKMKSVISKNNDPRRVGDVMDTVKRNMK